MPHSCHDPIFLAAKWLIIKLHGMKKVSDALICRYQQIWYLLTSSICHFFGVLFYLGATKVGTLTWSFMCSNTRDKIGFVMSTAMTKLSASILVLLLKSMFCLELDVSSEILWLTWWQYRESAANTLAGGTIRILHSKNCLRSIVLHWSDKIVWMIQLLLGSWNK